MGKTRFAHLQKDPENGHNVFSPSTKNHKKRAKAI